MSRSKLPAWLGNKGHPEPQRGAAAPATVWLRTEAGQFGFETLGAQGLAPAPTAGIGNDFVHAVIDGDRTGIRLEGEAAADKAVGHTVAIAIELQAEVFVYES
jgi:hypothetical protein